MARINNINDTQVRTDNGWYVSVKYQAYGDCVDIYLAHENGKGIEVCHFDDSGRINLSEYVEGKEPKPTMRINSMIWNGIKQAINGVEETPQKQSVDAELKATKYHLEDMRKLMKLVK